MAAKKKAKKKTAKKKAARRRRRPFFFERTHSVIAVSSPADIDKHVPEGHELLNADHLVVVGRKVWLLIVTGPKE